MITEQRIRELLAESKAPYAILGGNMPMGLLAFARLIEAESRAEMEAWRLNACQFHDDTTARMALAELVRLKTLKERIEVLGKQTHIKAGMFEEFNRLKREYEAGKEAAWDRAREALKG